MQQTPNRVFFSRDTSPGNHATSQIGEEGETCSADRASVYQRAFRTSRHKVLTKITHWNGPPAQDGGEFAWSRVEYECDLNHIRSLHIRVTVIIRLAAYADEFLRLRTSRASGKFECAHQRLIQALDEPQGGRLIGIADALRTLKTSEQVSYVLDSSLNLVCHNKAWDKFALENSGPELAGQGSIGTNLLEVTDESLRPFYHEAFNKVTRTKAVWEWMYECSSPESLRKFLMRVHPIEPDGWFLVTNNLVLEREHLPGKPNSVKDYVNAHGLIQVCVHCRCSKRVTPPERWDSVGAHLKPERTGVTHGLCPICREYFYPSLQG
jgi:hypothetical protein